MTPRLAKTLTAALLCGLAGPASAALPGIDLFNSPGIPGTGGYSTVMAPCYCTQQGWFSPIFLLAPGTYNFGTVREYWIESGFTPDGGPDQGYLYLLFSPMVTVDDYPYTFPPPPDYANPDHDLCAQDDAACIAHYQSAYVDFDLIYTVLPGQNAVQVGLLGNYVYTSPLPEPGALAMLALGLALVEAGRRRRTTRIG
jgi:hypothetical protein